MKMSQFVFLYRNTVQAEQEFARSPEEMQKSMQKWMAWMKELGEKGHIKDHGNPLEPGGKVVKGKQKSITDGPYAESKDIVGGYTLIEAKDLAEAAELSKGCPVFEAGGMVEVRPVMKLNM
jgi:hypothetical protein